MVERSSEFILGGQKSGKSRRAEELAQAWLSRDPSKHRAVMLATAQAHDAEMRARIERHQRDRASRVPGMLTAEVGVDLAEALIAHASPDTLIVVDCLTLWLTQLLMPPEGPAHGWGDARDPRFAVQQPAVDPLGPRQAALCEAIRTCPGPLVVVGNEIGLGVIPMGREVRAFVDALGRLNQDVAAVSQKVVLMVAGLPLVLKGQSA